MFSEAFGMTPNQAGVTASSNEAPRQRVMHLKSLGHFSLSKVQDVQTRGMGCEALLSGQK